MVAISYQATTLTTITTTAATLLLHIQTVSSRSYSKCLRISIFKLTPARLHEAAAHARRQIIVAAVIRHGKLS